jgi:hypothetical protein
MATIELETMIAAPRERCLGLCSGSTSTWSDRAHRRRRAER